MDYGDVATWGVATRSADGGLQVHENRSLSAAEEAAEIVPRLTVTGAHPNHRCPSQLHRRMARRLSPP